MIDYQALFNLPTNAAALFGTDTVSEQ